VSEGDEGVRNAGEKSETVEVGGRCGRPPRHPGSGSPSADLSEAERHIWCWPS